MYFDHFYSSVSNSYKPTPPPYPARVASFFYIKDVMLMH